MFFILQDSRESDALAIEIQELMFEIKSSNQHKSVYADSKFFANQNSTEWLKTATPVGTIEFVQSYLRYIHNISSMTPIGIPKELQIEKLLLRNYSVVEYDDITPNQNKFIKDISVLKQPTFVGNTTDFLEKNKKEKIWNQNHLFQVSDVIDILSEYRVIVHNHTILGIQFYDGDCTILPNEKEIRKIQEMILRYSQAKEVPKAYGMDVAVVSKKDGNRDLALIELEPFVAMGSYGCRGSFLPQLYKDGFEWYTEKAN